MDFSRTFYSNNLSKNKLYLSQNIFTNYTTENKSAKKIYYTNNDIRYKSISTSPMNNTSENHITKNNLKSINKLISHKLDKSRMVKTQLNSFYKEEIKYKIRKSSKYKSLFEKTEITNNFDNFQSSLDKKLINAKLKWNKKKYNFFNINSNKTNNLNKYKINTSNFSPRENNKSLASFESNHNKKNHINNSLNIYNTDNINKKYYTKTYYDIDLNNKKQSKKNIKQNIKSQICKNIKDEIFNDRFPPYPVDFREKNLINFYTQMKNFCYKRDCLYLQKKKLEIAKMKSDLLITLGDMEIIKYEKFYKLFKPYILNFQSYLFFLKEKIIKEFKENERLKLIENELVTDNIVLKKRILNTHKTLQSYLSDKYFLLCVKYHTLKIEEFPEKVNAEFKIDLQNLKSLKLYIKEISELATDENILAKNKNIIENKASSQNIHKDNISFITKIKKIRENFELTFNHDLSFEQIFQSAKEFFEGMNYPEERIENLLRKNNLGEIEMANLRDFITHNAIKIQKTKEKFLLNEYKQKKLEKDLLDEKRRNKNLINLKKKIMNTRKYNINSKIIKKIKASVNEIISINDKSLNKFFTKSRRLKDLPEIMLKSLENLIIFLINYKKEQKEHNNLEYIKIMKLIEKNNRLAIIEEKKEEYKKRAENKMRQLFEKNMKIYLIQDKRTNVKYQPLKKNIDLKDNDNKDDEKSIDLFY